MPKRWPSASTAEATRVASCVPGCRRWTGSYRNMKSVTPASFFDRVVASLFGGGQPRLDDEADRQLVDDTIEAVVDMVEPRGRHDTRYPRKLEGCVCKTIAYLRAIAREPLEPVVPPRAAWSAE